ncbi:MAG: hypothetical protein KF773_41915, partial [Deltaproteobacteria bacterium]|nr:hypothetical protein [Deltaproteobacteria bacterium]
MIARDDRPCVLDGDAYDRVKPIMSEAIRSWRQASRYSGVPITSLREAIARGDLPAPSTADDGSTVWDVAALDALREARSAMAIDEAIAGDDTDTIGPVASTLLPSPSA